MTAFYNWKNPLLISDKMIEKEHFDMWVCFFREREIEFNKQLDLNEMSSAGLDHAIFTFEKSAEQDFKNRFNIQIEIRKIIRHLGCQSYICPALIILPTT